MHNARRGPWHRPAQRGSAALLGTGARETAGNGGSPAWRQRRGVDGRGSGWDGGGVGEAVGTAARLARRSERGRHARGDNGARRAGRLSGGRCRDARRTVPTAALSHGIGAARGG
jgi:hypothetical protein